MHIQIMEWSYQAIRGINNLHISATKESGNPYHISMIMMPNGTGKTTTIDLLRAIFDGSALEWDPQKVKGYKPLNSSDDSGQFSVKMLIDNQHYTVFLNLDYVNGSASYQTSSKGQPTGGLNDGWELPSTIKTTFTPEFVKRFIFDGELAKEMLLSGSEEAEKALRFLYQLDILGQLRSRVDAIVHNEQQQAVRSKSITQAGITRYTNEVDRLNILLVSLEARKNLLTIELSAKVKRKHEIEKIINQKLTSNEKLRSEAEKTQIQRAEVTGNIQTKTLELFDKIRNPYYLSPILSADLNLLYDSMQTLQLPRTMSRNFFEELAEQDTCVCGRPISKVEKDCILRNSEQYMGSDEIGVINAIKSSIKGRNYSDDLIHEVQELQSLLNKLQECKNEWDRLQGQLTKAGDNEVDPLRKENEELIAKIELLNTELDDLTTNDPVKQKRLGNKNINFCDHLLDDANKTLKEVTDTVTISEKADNFKKYLMSIEKLALIELKKFIINETNNKIDLMLANNKITVSEINGYLQLKGQLGASMGQTLATAYAYLGTLFSSSAHKLPFIVDSPANPIDLDVRRQVAPILPQLFNQMIVFIMSGERLGFADYYYTLGDEVQYLTIYSQKEQETVCETGIDYFRTFQDEQPTPEVI